MSYQYDPVNTTLHKSTTFFMMVVGVVVGWGNVWKFPSLMYHNGGIVFLAAYLASLFLLAWPFLCLELGLGRITRRNPVSTTLLLAARSGVSSRWQGMVWLSLSASAIVLAFYTMVVGLGLSYLFSVAFGVFNEASESAIGLALADTLARPTALLFWQVLFLCVVGVVVMRGVRDGIGRAMRLLVPMLFLVLVLLLIRVYLAGEWAATVERVFRMEPDRFSWWSMVEAFNQAFFTLSLAMGVMMALGAYMPMHMSVPRTAMGIILADTVFAVGVALVLSFWLSSHPNLPDKGFGLVFESLPWIFGHIAWGQFWGVAFFILLSVAGWTSAVMLTEPLVSCCMELLAVRRRTATLWVLLLVFGLSALLAWSMAGGNPFRVAGLSLFGWLDLVSSRVLIPLAALLMVWFAGRKLDVVALQERVEFYRPRLFRPFYWHIRWVLPVFVILIALSGLQRFHFSSSCASEADQKSLICGAMRLVGFDDF